MPEPEIAAEPDPEPVELPDPEPLRLVEVPAPAEPAEPEPAAPEPAEPEPAEPAPAAAGRSLRSVAWAASMTIAVLLAIASLALTIYAIAGGGF